MEKRIVYYRIKDERHAIADMLSRVVVDKDLRGLLATRDGNNKAALINQSNELFNIESWWFLVFRTCDAISAQAIAKFCTVQYHVDKGHLNAGDGQDDLQNYFESFA